jgi:acyl-CoA dehydrogenase
MRPARPPYSPSATMGYTAEYHVERYLRESYIPRIAPITPHMILNFIAEKALGLPRSY